MIAVADVSLGPWQPVLMWAIFALTYLGIALGGFPYLVLDRTGIALLGAIAMLWVRGLSIQQAASHIDYETILLLFGLMIFSAQQRSRGHSASPYPAPGQSSGVVSAGTDKYMGR